jgi:phosphate transport system substrate-binding protein
MKIIAYILLIGAVVMASCNQAKENKDIETARRGRFKLVVDDSYKPIIDSQLEVFTNKYPDIKVDLVYTNEANCFNMLDDDSATRMIITSKKLTEQDYSYYNDRFPNGIMSSLVALDAVAIILHPSAPKQMLTIQDIKDALEGKSKYGYKPVFDGVKETANLRYILDTLYHNTKTVPSGVTGLNSNKAVIDFVARNPNAMGFIGVNWIGDGDPDSHQFDKRIQVASIQCVHYCPSYVYKKPVQLNLAERTYPFVRGIYYVVKNDRGGVATNFAKWLEQEAAQLNFNAGYLVGTKFNAYERDAEYDNK